MKFAEKQCDTITKYLLPERIVCKKDCISSDALLEEKPRQAVLGDECAAILKKGGYVILDFGQEIHGGVAVTIKLAQEGARLRIVFGESVSEAMSILGEKNATNAHAIRDAVFEVTSWQHFRTWNMGFRFLKLEAINEDIHLAGIQAAFEYRNLKYKGSFQCNDKLLNKIWKTGAYTVHLNMQEYLWDGIKRDRLVWIGDMHPEVSTILAVFGDVQVVRDSLELIEKHTSCDEWMNGIASYNMWWIRILYDCYMETGDKTYLQQSGEYLYGVIRHTLSCIHEDGTNDIENKFVEWPSKQTKEELAGFQAMLVHGLTYGSRICEILGNTDLAAQCNEKIKLLRGQKYEYAGNKQIAAMVSLMDMGDSKEISEHILKPQGAKGLSTFWGYYTLQALAKTGDYQAALDIIRDYWGLMIKFGATTFWEDFDVDWTRNAVPIDELIPEGKDDLHGDFGRFCYKQFRHSLCHGWASGPTAFLSRYILGVECLEPGYKTVRIHPHLGDLEWAKGKYPTPYGIIKISHKKVNGEIISEIKAPKEICVITDAQKNCI